jgi:hypothetical protein
MNEERDFASLPPHVRGGIARMRKLREDLEAHGSDLSSYQRGLYDKAIQAHPDLPRRGALAANQAQLRAWGRSGYIQQRCDAFRACAEKHGIDFARECVKRATEARRQYRLLNPTRGERALRDLLVELGFDLVIEPTPFDYTHWCVRPDEYGWPDCYPVAMSNKSAVIEAYVGNYICDVVLPVQQLAIEVYGGIHALHAERDARREAVLRSHRLQVLILSEQQACDCAQARQQIMQALPEIPLA